MHRSILYTQEQARTFDLLWAWKDVLTGLGFVAQDHAGATTTVVSGFAPTQTATPSLTINVAAGRIYQTAAIDPTAYGALALDNTVVMQQGIAAAQTLTFSNSTTTAQSQWQLVQAQFTETDAIRATDPTSGVLFFWNSANPSSPLSGPGGSNAALPTIRQSLVTLSIVAGTPAATGTEVPPNPTAGWVPLFLIDLAFGQTQIFTANILTAGPSVGVGVPNNYTQAPFLAGLLKQHHLGITGQAPQINLATEVQGNLLIANRIEAQRIITVNTTVTLLATDETVMFNRATPAAQVANLPTTASLQNNQKIRITDVAGNFTGNALTVTANAGQTFANGGGTTLALSTNFATNAFRWVSSLSKWTVEP